jgi:subtilase family serine protease
VRAPALPAGSYFLITCADLQNKVAETDETNNCAASAGTGTVGPADLVIASLDEPPASIPAGSSFPIADSTANVGDGTAVNSTTRFFLSADALPGGDLAVDGERFITQLAPGATDTATTEVSLPFETPPADYFLLACADSGGTVAEVSEINKLPGLGRAVHGRAAPGLRRRRPGPAGGV